MCLISAVATIAHLSSFLALSIILQRSVSLKLKLTFIIDYIYHIILVNMLHMLNWYLWYNISEIISVKFYLNKYFINLKKLQIWNLVKFKCTDW